MIKILILLFFSGCSFQADSSSGGGLNEQPGREFCVEACDNLINLGCDLGKSIIYNDKIYNCYARCGDEHKEGFFWNTYCLMDIDSCDKIESYCKSMYRKY